MVPASEHKRYSPAARNPASFPGPARRSSLCQEASYSLHPRRWLVLLEHYPSLSACLSAWLSFYVVLLPWFLWCKEEKKGQNKGRFIFLPQLDFFHLTIESLMSVWWHGSRSQPCHQMCPSLSVYCFSAFGVASTRTAWNTDWWLSLMKPRMKGKQNLFF